MFPAPFDYVRASSLSDAVSLLARHGDDAKVLAGGHSLIPAMKLRLARPAILIDLAGVAELSGVRDHDGVIAIGAMATHRQIETSPLLAERCPLLPNVASCIGDAQVRNRGTIGGSLVHADPAADWPAAMLALDATIVLAGQGGLREVKASAFFTGIMQTATAPDEILCEIRVPATGRGVAYVKTEQKASGFALCGVAVVVDGSRASFGVTGVAPVPYRVTDHAKIVDGIEPLSDIHATAEYRAHLARVNAGRALAAASGKG